MRIVHYLTRIALADGGVVRAVLDLCGRLADRGHDVALISHFAPDAPPSWLRREPGRPRIVPIEPPRRFGRFGPAALSTINAELRGADALHLHVPWEVSNLELAAAARRASVPYIISIHGMLDDWSMTQGSAKKRAYLALRGRRLLEHAAAVHCTAEAELAQARRWFPRGNGVVLPLVFDLETFRNLPGPDAARKAFPIASTPLPRILFLSRIHHKKGLDRLIEAVALLRDQSIEVALLIAGAGDAEYEQRCRRLVDQHNLAGCCAFLGMVMGESKLSLYQAADLFVLPTSQENWGFVSLEALACGTPVITTKGVDIWPELERSGGAVITGPTPLEVADAIRPLIADRAKLAAMGAAGRAWIFENLNEGAVIAQYESLYASARARRR